MKPRKNRFENQQPAEDGRKQRVAYVLCADAVSAIQAQDRSRCDGDSKDGSIELGGTLPRGSTPNLVFHENRLLLQADFQGRSGLAILDTGATTTDFNANFASLFADLLERSGKKGTQEISGIGGTQVFESVTLPEFTLTIGPKASTTAR